MFGKEWLGLLALVIQIVSFPIAAWALYMTRKEAKASRDLQIALTLSESFRSRWEGGWSSELYKIRLAQDAAKTNEVPEKDRDPLYQMLNWIDWLGVLIREKSLTEKAIIFRSITPQFRQIINTSRTFVEEEIQREGPEYWSGVLIVANSLGIEWTKEYYRGLTQRSPTKYVLCC